MLLSVVAGEGASDLLSESQLSLRYVVCCLSSLYTKRLYVTETVLRNMWAYSLRLCASLQLPEQDSGFDMIDIEECFRAYGRLTQGLLPLTLALDPQPWVASRSVAVVSMEVNNDQSQDLGLQLPPALQLHVLSILPLNDRALSGRLVFPDAAAGLSEPQHCTASLSQPLPPHAVPWAVEAGRQHVRQLPFRHKLQLLSTAAASGSEVNLDVALALLQPSIFPELLHGKLKNSSAYSNPGVAAVEAGHPQLLGWLLRHCPALLADSRAILKAAARHCGLPGLQAVWAVLGCSNSTDLSPLMDQDFFNWVAASPSGAMAKMEWVLAQGRGSCSLQESTAAAAARSGDLGRLRWLRDRGCPVDMGWVLVCALEKADLAVAQWLVGEAGCVLPATAAGDDERWERLLDAAAKSPNGVPKLQWLHERGAPPLSRDTDSDLILLLLHSAAAAGRVEVVRHLMSLVAPMARLRFLADGELFHCAVSSGSIPTAEFLRQAGCAVSYAAYEVAAQAAADKDSLIGGDSIAIIRWLVQEARVPAAGFDLEELLLGWPSDTPADSRDLLAVVQLLLGECKLDEGGELSYVDAMSALDAAAGRGELALVQYLLQQRPGFPPNWGIVMAAAEGGCEALLEWLVEQHPGCLEGAGSGVSPYASAAARGDLGTLTALRRLGVPWSAENVVAQAVREGAAEHAMRWLEEQGAPGGSEEEVA